MKALTPTPFEPADKPPEAPQLKFMLRPLDWATDYHMRLDELPNGAPSPAAAEAMFRYAVVGWSGAVLRGEPLEYSASNLERLLATATLGWRVAILQCVVEIRRRSNVDEDTEKNS